MIAEELKKETKDAHQALEKLLIPRIKQVATKDGYLSLLSLFYGYYEPLEKRIAQFIDSELVSDTDIRRQAHWLLNDMKHFGVEPEAVSLAGTLPEIDNTAQAFGALYVLEGSALGGKVIKKMIQNNLNTADDSGFSFYTGYGDESMAMWSKFIAAINNFAASTDQNDIIIAAANETFACFKHWAEVNDQ